LFITKGEVANFAQLGEVKEGDYAFNACRHFRRDPRGGTLQSQSKHCAISLQSYSTVFFVFNPALSKQVLNGLLKTKNHPDGVGMV
jgi:hypothetical protein